MVKAHESDLTIERWGDLTGSDHMIVQIAEGGYAEQDYILFHQVDSAGADTGLYQMVQVTGIDSDDGLKDGYALITYSKL